MGAFNKVKYGLTSGVLWGLDTVILGIALTMSPYIGTLEAFAFAAIASSALHDIFCAIWLAIYMGVRGRLKDTWAALRTRSGKVVVLGALLGGPIGMTGYVIAINNIGAGYTAIISAFYPAVGAILSFIILKERMNAKQLIAFACALGGIVAMGMLSLTDAETVGDPVLGLVGAAACVLGWGSEAVLCGWGMRDDAVDNETALQIRETTSALVYAIVVLPAFGAWAFTVSAFPSVATGCHRVGGIGWHDVVPVLLQVHQFAFGRGKVHGTQYQLFGMGSALCVRAAGYGSDARLGRMLRRHSGGDHSRGKRLERALWTKQPTITDSVPGTLSQNIDTSLILALF